MPYAETTAAGLDAAGRELSLRFDNATLRLGAMLATVDGVLATTPAGACRDTLSALRDLIASAASPSPGSERQTTRAKQVDFGTAYNGVLASQAQSANDVAALRAFANAALDDEERAADLAEVSVAISRRQVNDLIATAQAFHCTVQPQP